MAVPNLGLDDLEPKNRHSLDDEPRNLHQRCLSLENEALGDDDVPDDRSDCNNDAGDDEEGDDEEGDDRSVVEGNEVANDVFDGQNEVKKHSEEDNFVDDYMDGSDRLEDDGFADL